MNYRFLIPMMAYSFCELTVITIVRVTTSYRAIELELSPLWIGIITAAFAILPVVAVLKIGRAVDRGHGILIVRMGGAGLVLACVGLTLSQALPSLLIFTAFLGLSHLFLTIGTQVLCSLQPGKGVMERSLGNYMVANSLGQGIGPLIVGWAGGSAAIPPIAPLFTVALGVAAIGAICTILLTSAHARPVTLAGTQPSAISDILAIPGFKSLLLISVVTVVAQDLSIVYFPLLGNERGIAVDIVGWLLTLRAAAAVVVRLFYSNLNAWLGAQRLMMMSTTLGAAAFFCLAAPLPLALTSLAIAITGGAIGIAVTVSMALLLSTAGTTSRGAANSLRSGGVRAGQVAVPIAAGAVAAAAGAASIFVIVGAALVATAATYYRDLRTQQKAGEPS